MAPRTVVTHRGLILALVPPFLFCTVFAIALNRVIKTVQTDVQATLGRYGINNVSDLQQKVDWAQEAIDSTLTKIQKYGTWIPWKTLDIDQDTVVKDLTLASGLLKEFNATLVTNYLEGEVNKYHSEAIRDVLLLSLGTSLGTYALIAVASGNWW
jgi:hypothetical protein